MHMAARDCRDHAASAAGWCASGLIMRCSSRVCIQQDPGNQHSCSQREQSVAGSQEDAAFWDDDGDALGGPDVGPQQAPHKLQLIHSRHRLALITHLQLSSPHIRQRCAGMNLCQGVWGNIPLHA